MGIKCQILNCDQSHIDALDKLPRRFCAGKHTKSLLLFLLNKNIQRN